MQNKLETHELEAEYFCNILNNKEKIINTLKQQNFQCDELLKKSLINDNTCAIPENIEEITEIKNYIIK